MRSSICHIRIFTENLLFSLTLLLLISCSDDEVEPRVIFSNESLYDQIIAQGVDLDEDLKISLEEAELTKKLVLSGKEINNLRGLRFFTNLEQLGIFNTSLTTIDVSEFSKLKSLLLYQNQITALDLSENQLLEVLDCQQNKIGSLDLSHNPIIHFLHARNNEISVVDIESNPALRFLNLSGNQIDSIQLDRNTKLEHIDLSDNNLSRISLSQNQELIELWVARNEITDLVLPTIESKNALRTLDISYNQLTTVDLTAYEYLEFLDFSGMPQLEKVVVWWCIREPTALKMDYAGSANAYIDECPKDEFDIPDKLLRKRLRRHDQNDDGGISIEEAESVDSLTLEGWWGHGGEDPNFIRDPSGLEYFKNLKYLDLGHNSIRTIDLSNFSKLEYLNLTENGIKSIDLLNNLELRSLYLGENYMLNELNLEGNPNLERLSIVSCSLESLDTHFIPKLNWLYMEFNSFSNIDVSYLPELEFLWTWGNDLEQLNVSNNKKLIGLSIGSDLIEEIDLIENILLRELYISGSPLNDINVTENTELQKLLIWNCQISSLDISQNTNLTLLDLWDLTNLGQVCTWIEPFPPAGLKLSMNGSPSIFFTTDCSLP